MHTKSMIQALISSMLLFAGSQTLSAGELCGSKEGYFNQLASTYLIPDFFPPENELAQLLPNEDRERCEAIGSVQLGKACLSHDLCYAQRLDKGDCDKKLQDAWVKECRKVFSQLSRDQLVCRLTCEGFVKLMSEAQRFDEEGFCPSCTAYDNAG